jgi:hypothetical protein
MITLIGWIVIGIVAAIALGLLVGWAAGMFDWGG